MIKKTIILASVLTFAMSTAFAATPAKTITPVTPAVPATVIAAPACTEMTPQPPCHKHRDQFENRLNLTEAQKEQAKQIRMKGHEEMRPVIEKIKCLKQEKEAVKRSRIAVQAQEEKIAVIDGQIKVLKKEMRELRTKNMKEFEAILTPKQKKELAKMKDEGRKRYEKHQKNGGCCEKKEFKSKCDCPEKCDCRTKLGCPAKDVEKEPAKK